MSWSTMKTAVVKQATGITVNCYQNGCFLQNEGGHSEYFAMTFVVVDVDGTIMKNSKTGEQYRWVQCSFLLRYSEFHWIRWIGKNS